jgi:hypothetical protein
MGMQEGIKIVNVRLTKIGVNSFSLNDSTVTFEVGFDDGMKKQVYKTATLDEPNEVADSIVEGIIRMEENINMEFDGRDISGEANVILADCDLCRIMLAEFFKNVSAKLYRVKNAKISDGYMDAVKKLQNSELRINV